MSIEDKKNNESLEEDTAKHRTVSDGPRKNKKQRQPSSSDTNEYTPNPKASEVSHEERLAEKAEEPSITTPEALKETPALKSEKSDQQTAAEDRKSVV